MGIVKNYVYRYEKAQKESLPKNHKKSGVVKSYEEVEKKDIPQDAREKLK